jgi:hypothetical protein
MAQARAAALAKAVQRLVRRGRLASGLMSPPGRWL